MYKKFKEGRNNKVFLLKKEKQKLIAKKYKKGFTTKYSRFLTEKTFLNFLNKKKIKIIPKIISVDKENEIIFFNFIKGYSIKRPNKKQLKECLKFLVKINYSTNYKKFKFQLASDACLSIKDHINTCESRIRKLTSKHKKKKNLEHRKIFEFLENKIIPEFEKLKYETNIKFSKSQILKKIKKEDLILSPSDFGFHNIISKNRKLYFIDFEYAGWDDPNKLLCDFFLNPDYFISDKNKKYFLSNFIRFFKKKISNLSKFNLILKFHFLKWVCVIINQSNIKISKNKKNVYYFKKATNYFYSNKNILK